MLDFMGDMKTWQWIALAILGLWGLWPRRQAILGLLTDSVPAGTTLDANKIAAAYRLLAPYLEQATAANVRAEVAEVFLTIRSEPAAAIEEEFRFSTAQLLEVLNSLKGHTKEAKS